MQKTMTEVTELTYQAPTLVDLVGQLSSSDAVERIKARKLMVQEGRRAALAVAPLARSSNRQTRWECAKTLCEIADPVSIEPLIQLLEDRDEGVRWDAALGLIAIGQPAVNPLLREIIARAKDRAILPGARHVIHQLSKTDWGRYLRPVYEALDSNHASESAPVAANKALHRVA